MLSGDVKEKSLQHIMKKHTRKVTYYGKNNQRYSKDCVPKKKDIYISDVSQLYIPENNIDFSLNNKSRNIVFFDNSTPKFYAYEHDIFQCYQCQ